MKPLCLQVCVLYLLFCLFYTDHHVWDHKTHILIGHLSRKLKTFCNVCSPLPSDSFTGRQRSLHSRRWTFTEFHFLFCELWSSIFLFFGRINACPRMVTIHPGPVHSLIHDTFDTLQLPWGRFWGIPCISLVNIQHGYICRILWLKKNLISKKSPCRTDTCLIYLVVMMIKYADVCGFKSSRSLLTFREVFLRLY